MEDLRLEEIIEALRLDGYPESHLMPWAEWLHENHNNELPELRIHIFQKLYTRVNALRARNGNH